MNIREVMASKLREARKAKHMSAQQVGELVGKSTKTVYAWESGLGQPDADMLIKLSRIYDLTVADFYTADTIGTDKNWVEVPFYGSIAAGEPIEMIDPGEAYLVPPQIAREGAHIGVVKISGNSWNREIPDGYLAAIDFDITTPSNSHEPFAVCIDGSRATVKAIEKLENGVRLIPNSYDPTIQPIVIDFSEETDVSMKVLGKVVWAFAPFDYRF